MCNVVKNLTANSFIAIETQLSADPGQGMYWNSLEFIYNPEIVLFLPIFQEYSQNMSKKCQVFETN